MFFQDKSCPKRKVVYRPLHRREEGSPELRGSFGIYYIPGGTVHTSYVDLFQLASSTTLFIVLETDSLRANEGHQPVAQYRQVPFLGRMPSAAHSGRAVRRQWQLAHRRRDQGRVPRLHV